MNTISETLAIVLSLSIPQCRAMAAHLEAYALAAARYPDPPITRAQANAVGVDIVSGGAGHGVTDLAVLEAAVYLNPARSLIPDLTLRCLERAWTKLNWTWQFPGEGTDTPACEMLIQRAEAKIRALMNPKPKPGPGPLPVIYMAPVPGAHKVTDAPCVYVRRPAEFTRGQGSATAIKVEAYVPGNPRDDHGVESWKNSELSDPILVCLVWVSRDHRSQWDARTRGRTGNTATIGTLNQYVTGDVDALHRAVNEALSAIEAWTVVTPDLDFGKD